MNLYRNIKTGDLVKAIATNDSKRVHAYDIAGNEVIHEAAVFSKKHAVVKGKKPDGSVFIATEFEHAEPLPVATPEEVEIDEPAEVAIKEEAKPVKAPKAAKAPKVEIAKAEEADFSPPADA